MKHSIVGLITATTLCFYCGAAKAANLVRFEYDLSDGNSITGVLEGNLVRNELQDITSARILEFSGDSRFEDRDATIRRDIGPVTFNLEGTGQEFLSLGVFLEDVLPPITLCLGFFSPESENEFCDDAFLEITLFGSLNGFGTVETADFVNVGFEPDFNDGKFPANTAFSLLSNPSIATIVSRSATIQDTEEVPETDATTAIGILMFVGLAKRVLEVRQ